MTVQMVKEVVEVNCKDYQVQEDALDLARTFLCFYQVRRLRRMKEDAFYKEYFEEALELSRQKRKLFLQQCKEAKDASWGQEFGSQCCWVKVKLEVEDRELVYFNFKTRELVRLTDVLRI